MAADVTVSPCVLMKIRTYMLAVQLLSFITHVLISRLVYHAGHNRVDHACHGGLDGQRTAQGMHQLTE